MLFRNIQTWTFKSKNKYIMEKNSIKVEFILLGKRIHVLWCWKDLFVCTNDANCKIIQQNIHNNQAIFYIVYSDEKRDIFAIWSSHKMPVLNIIEHFFFLMKQFLTSTSEIQLVLNAFTVIMMSGRKNYQISDNVKSTEILSSVPTSE